MTCCFTRREGRDSGECRQAPGLSILFSGGGTGRLSANVVVSRVSAQSTEAEEMGKGGGSSPFTREEEVELAESNVAARKIGLAVREREAVESPFTFGLLITPPLARQRQQAQVDQLQSIVSSAAVETPGGLGLATEAHEGEHNRTKGERHAQHNTRGSSRNFVAISQRATSLTPRGEFRADGCLQQPSGSRNNAHRRVGGGSARSDEGRGIGDRQGLSRK